MTRLLHLDSSPRGPRSHTRKLTGEFVSLWLGKHPGTTVVYRDIGHNPPSPVNEGWIAAAFAAPEVRTAAMESALAESQELIDEVLTADTYVMGVPMYNFGVPSHFKAYIDQVARIGQTWDFNKLDLENPYVPLLKNKKLFVVTSRGDGGYAPGERNARLNHQDPWLKTIFAFMGVTDVRFIHVENDEFGGTKLEQSLETARREMREILR